MRHTPLAALLFCLAFVNCVSAQPQTSAQFEEQCYGWLETGNLAKLAWTVRYYRPTAREAFTRVLSQHEKDPTTATERWLNSVARAFRLEGMGRPNRVLESKGILWPITRWRGTMFQADGANGEYDLHGTWD